MNNSLFSGVAALALIASSQAMAAAPINNLQPSLALTEVFTPTGVFPSGGGGGSATGNTLGFVYNFAGDYLPGNAWAANGQLINIGANPINYDIYGTTYGGDGVNTFALPNLNGTAVIGAGSGAGLPVQVLGVATGSPTITLTPTQLPGPGQQPFNNIQPSLPLETLIATDGSFPEKGGSNSSTFVGQIANFAGDFIPGGWMLAAGQLIPIQGNTALFSVIGTTYGGNGTTNFRLPDLQGRVAVGADATNPLATAFGQASTLLTPAQLLPGAPITDDQPSLAINYLIATLGIFPAGGGGGNSQFNATTPTLGEIVGFAGNYAPDGWALADGQLLSIQDNEALFAVLGTTYGGDGVTTFALPNLDGRTIIGADGDDPVGTEVGEDQFFLNSDNTPRRPPALPEPATWAMLLAGIGAIGGALRSNRRKNLGHAPTA